MDHAFTILALHKKTDNPLPQSTASQNPKLLVHIVSLLCKNLKKIFTEFSAQNIPFFCKNLIIQYQYSCLLCCFHIHIIRGFFHKDINFPEQNPWHFQLCQKDPLSGKSLLCNDHATVKQNIYCFGSVCFLKNPFSPGKRSHCSFFYQQSFHLTFFKVSAQPASF